MGYNAFVACNCYQQGLATASPYPGLTEADEEGPYLVFPANIWQTDKQRALAMDAAFDTWRETACAHPSFKAANERLANMSGMGAFRHLIHERGGVVRYPVLTQQMPHGMGSNMPASLAPALLQELAALAAEPAETLAVLREEASQDIIYSVNANSGTYFVYAGSSRHRYALDAQGFCIVREHPAGADYGEEVFRALRFEQQQLAAGRFRFTNTVTGQHYNCSVGLHPDGRPRGMPCRFAVELETVLLAQEYAYILEPLRQLAEAAIQTGNPICWA